MQLNWHEIRTFNSVDVNTVTRAANQSHVVQAMLAPRLVSQSVKWKNATSNTVSHVTKRFNRRKKRFIKELRN